MYVFFSLGFFSIVYSQEGQPVPARTFAREWKDGWGLMVGGGVSMSKFINESSLFRSGFGPNFTTALIYCDRIAFCWELGSSVSYHEYDDVEINDPNNGDLVLDFDLWESFFYLSVRTRFPSLSTTEWKNLWLRFNLGYGTSVAFVEEVEVGVFDAINHPRVHTEGPLLGFSIMNLFGELSNRRLWYIELSISTQIYWDSFIVEGGQLLPKVVETTRISGNPHLVHVSINIGTRLF
jgi:hypothetical protein